MIQRLLKGLRHPRQGLRWLFPYDYISPNLLPLPSAIEVIEEYFPDVIRGRSKNPRVPHYSRCDRRYPEMGLTSWDESTLLYNYGRQLAGRDVLEIGCWIGWSTVALGLGGAQLTVIDPVLGGAPQGLTCRNALERAGLADSVRLIGGYSPKAVEELAAEGCTWSGCFIDAVHDGIAPLLDTQACVRAAREDCLILFHDLIQPDVGKALSWLQQEGWNCGVHYTNFFIGVAWRGSMRPLQHICDSRVDWTYFITQLCPHLTAFQRI